MLSTKMYTPEEVSIMLQLSKNTVYELIKQGEIVAKKIGRVYRIPQSSLSFVFFGLDNDILKAEQEDLKNIEAVQESLSQARKGL